MKNALIVTALYCGGVARASLLLVECGQKYARSLGEAFGSHVEELARSKLKSVVQRPSNKSAIVGIGPGSSGTRSLFISMVFLDISGIHFKKTFQNCSWGHARATPSANSFQKSQFEFWADTPVPATWTQLLDMPNAKFVMTRLKNASAWKKKRMTFRKGYCANPRLSDCQVPLAFENDGRGSKLPVARATLNQVEKALDAYHDFAECVIPKERLLFVDFPPEDSGGLWEKLLDFVDPFRTRISENRRTELINSSFPHWGESSCVWGERACQVGIVCSRL